MIYLELFLSFLKIGFTSFGGMSMIPLILEEMTSHGWMSAEDLSNLIAIAEMTPGSLGVNCATFAGMQTAGTLGGIFAVAGVLTPAFTLTAAVGVLFARFRENTVVAQILRFIKPICVAMILNVAISLGMGSFLPEGAVDFTAIAIFCASFAMLRFCKFSIPAVIAASAVMGLLFYGIL